MMDVKNPNKSSTVHQGYRVRLQSTISFYEAMNNLLNQHSSNAKLINDVLHVLEENDIYSDYT